MESATLFSPAMDSFEISKTYFENQEKIKQKRRR